MNCLHCTKLLPPPIGKVGRPRKYCSMRCNDLYIQAKRKAQRAAQRKPKCLVCGVELPVRSKYCSPEHRRAWAKVCENFSSNTNDFTRNV